MRPVVDQGCGLTLFLFGLFSFGCCSLVCGKPCSLGPGIGLLLGNLSFVACLPQLTHCLGTGSCPNHIILYDDITSGYSEPGVYRSTGFPLGLDLRYGAGRRGDGLNARAAGWAAVGGDEGQTLQPISKSRSPIPASMCIYNIYIYMYIFTTVFIYLYCLHAYYIFCVSLFSGCSLAN